MATGELLFFGYGGPNGLRLSQSVRTSWTRLS